jgi:valyl-tRNA synthetase
VITAIRNVRSEYNVNPKTPVTVHLSVPGDAAMQQTQDNREMIELLATCRIEKIGSGLVAPADAARGTGDGFEVFALNLIDPDAEAKRVAKLRDELTKKIAALRGRLANPAYADKAPAHLVQQTRDELATFEAELAKLG